MKLNAEDVAPRTEIHAANSLSYSPTLRAILLVFFQIIQGVFKSLLIKVQGRNTAYLLMCEFPDIVTVTLTIRQSKP